MEQESEERETVGFLDAQSDRSDSYTGPTDTGKSTTSPRMRDKLFWLGESRSRSRLNQADGGTFGKWPLLLQYDWTSRATKIAP